MRISIGITRGLTVAALVGLVILSALGFRAQERDLAGLRESSQESIFWDASQSEAELARFVAALARYALGDPAVTPAEVNKRFDILWSRVALFRQGDVGRRLARYDADRQVIAELRGLLEKYDTTIVNLSRPVDGERIQRILAEFTAAGEHLRALSLEVLQAEEERLAMVREHVRSSARLTWMVSMAALMLALLLIGIMLIETRRYRRMAEESAELASRAEAASRAKTRFLTMMSHELRTPMNGVLGLLALVRQTSLSDRQLRLVERAERSGRQMSALLGDILDFSDLQSEKLVVDRDMFELPRLARSVEEMFGHIVQREGVAFRIELGPELPRWVVGDLGRLRQALGHFVTFFVDIVGSKDIRLAMSRDDDGVRFEIDAAVQGDDLPGWQPEAMMGRTSAAYGDFASDSLGPMIARGLIALMGGSVALNRPAPGRATLSVHVPLQVIDGATECVRVEADSVTVQSVVGALLRRLGYEIWEPGRTDRTVTAVAMEAGGDDETTRAARLRSDHPAAWLIAIGEPKMAGVFDAVCKQPITSEALGSVLRNRERSRRVVV